MNNPPGAQAGVTSGAAPPLRIAVAIHDFALGGTERIAIRLANRWAEGGCEVRVLAGSADGPLRALLGDRVKLIMVGNGLERRAGSVARLGRAVARQLARDPVDLLFVPGNFHWPIAGAVARIDRPPRIVAQVSNVLRKPQRGALRQLIFEARMRRRLRHADVVVTMCEADRLLANRILRRSDCVALPLPALEDVSPAPVAADPAERVVMSAGRFVPQKAFEVLIEAFALVARRDAAARLVLVGEGPQRGLLERAIAAQGLGEVVSLPGYVEDVRPWLDRARLFVLSSRFEGYGAVIIEALAAGRPVVATASTPAADELLGDPEAGEVVPIEDPQALAAAIQRQLERPMPDPQSLAALVEEYRIGPVARRYEALFRGLVTPA